jgi:hypothetical protein
MNILHDYFLFVDREAEYYRKGLQTKQELDCRLQKLAKNYDRQIFRLEKMAKEVRGNVHS